ncbi:hypothetical protein HYV10_03190 [Candidatus Dependentiae bacterium]|nr:hypothetical protein [Candidatus Dependentiae bacterium]
MKICIYQIAFIAAIFSISKSLNCKHNDHSIEPVKDLVTADKDIHASMRDLFKEIDRVEELHNSASRFDSKDKSVSGVRRSRIKKAQSLSSNGSAQKDREIHKTIHYFKKTQEQIESAINLMKNSNSLTNNALTNIPNE